MAIDHNAIFLLTSADPDRKKNFGTGFAIAHKDGKLFLLTCAHVVEDIGGKVKVGGLKAEVVAAGLGSSIDLAVLSIPCEKPPHLLNRIAAEKKEGDRFQICGYSLFAGAKDSYVLRKLEGSLGKSISFTMTDGSKVEAWDIRIEDDDFAKLQGGYSGSPLCDKDGNLIAVVSHSIADGQRGHAISVANLRLIYPELEEMIPYERSRKKFLVIIALLFVSLISGVWMIYRKPDSLIFELSLKYEKDISDDHVESADTVAGSQNNRHVQCRKTEIVAIVDGKTERTFSTTCRDENGDWYVPVEAQQKQYKNKTVCRKAEIAAIFNGSAESVYSTACLDKNGDWQFQDQSKQDVTTSKCRKVEIISVVDGKTKRDFPTVCRDKNGEWEIKKW